MNNRVGCRRKFRVILVTGNILVIEDHPFDNVLGDLTVRDTPSKRGQCRLLEPCTAGGPEPAILDLLSGRYNFELFEIQIRV